ncbi:hypothetical protein Ctaglu_33580 [Clostridium tagluense]|uniref:Uncharacterized protein n=1 Tax=Clostridium tagluense TaxID=360422 RepID=A0A401UQB7_9CLOT|nr:hypothetical protein Ctaglu_33580 [Clostridium tagluense]
MYTSRNYKRILEYNRIAKCGHIAKEINNRKKQEAIRRILEIIG